MDHLEFETRCERLYGRALSGQWDPDRAIPWDMPVLADEVTLRAPLVTGEMAETWSHRPAALRGDLFRVCMGTLLTNLAVGESFVDGASAALSERLTNAHLRGFLALQAIDEARHEKVLIRYVQDKLGFDRLPTRHIAASRLPEGTMLAGETWQSTAMLILILEIAAMAAIQGMREYCDEPLMQHLLRRVVSDESRHISGLTLALREPGASIDDTQRERLKDIVVLGWRQGLAVTEKPVLKVAQMLAGDLEEKPHPEWYFFRKMIGSTMIPKLKLAGVYDDDLEARLRAAGCPIEATSALEAC